MLLLKLAETCVDEGISVVDLGRGMAAYKKRMMSDAITVAQGSVDLRPIARVARATWRKTRDAIRNSPLRAPAKLPAKMLHQIKEWIEFR